MSFLWQKAPKNGKESTISVEKFKASQTNNNTNLAVDTRNFWVIKLELKIYGLLFSFGHKKAVFY